MADPEQYIAAARRAVVVTGVTLLAVFLGLAPVAWWSSRRDHRRPASRLAYRGRRRARRRGRAQRRTAALVQRLTGEPEVDDTHLPPPDDGPEGFRG